MDRDAVINRAKQVGDLAEWFVLSNAVMATRKLLQDEAARSCDLESKRTAVQNAATDEGVSASKADAFKNIKSVPRIVVDFSDRVDDARTFMAENGYFEMILPMPSNPITIEEIERLRMLVGHELGHLMLHLDEMLRIGHHYRGTKCIDDEELEKEAELFSEETVRLRREHIKRLWSS
jgi:hypothetical protein